MIDTITPFKKDCRGQYLPISSLVKCEDIKVHSLWHLSSVGTTVTKIALAIIGCTAEIVHIIWTTISHSDGWWPGTASWTPVPTHRSANLTVCYCGVSTSHPARYISIAFECRWTWSWHPCAGRPLETEPSRAESIITLITYSGISNLPVSAVENSVILTFCHKRKKKMIIDVIISTLKRHWIFLDVKTMFSVS